MGPAPPDEAVLANRTAAASRRRGTGDVGAPRIPL